METKNVSETVLPPNPTDLHFPPSPGPSPDQVKLFRALFRGRQDAYGKETSSGSVAVRESFSDQVIRDHLTGGTRRGVYLLIDGELVWFAVIDLDELDKEKATRIYVACLEHNLFPYVERSRVKGFHIWIFFDEPVPAGAVRRALSKILKEAGVDCEVFPKQDSLTSDDGLGNFVYLPLFGESVKNGRTVFLNSQFEPYPDQWEFMSKIQRTKSENIVSMAEEVEEEPPTEKQAPDSESAGGLNVEKFLPHYRIAHKVKKETGRTFYLLNRCLFSENHTTKDNPGDSSIIQDDSGKITYQCFHGHCKGRTWADARLKISGGDSLAQFCREEVTGRSGKNLTEEIRSWVDGAFSRFTTDMIYRDLEITEANKKAHVRVEIGRLVQKGVLERGSVNGSFVKIECQTKVLEIKAERPTPLKISLPGNLQKRVSIYKHNLLVVAGSSNGGKTAYALNAAYDNRNLFDVHYLTTEMDSDELTLRVHNFGYPLKEWSKVTFKPWESIHSIKPDAFNIVDYLEVKEGEFWRVGDDLRKIFEKLNSGIALVCLQMDKGSKFGWGGQKTVDKARLYFSLDDNKLTIVKGKNWAGLTNPNGEVIPFKIIQGARFEWGQS